MHMLDYLSSPHSPVHVAPLLATSWLHHITTSLFHLTGVVIETCVDRSYSSNAVWCWQNLCFYCLLSLHPLTAVWVCKNCASVCNQSMLAVDEYVFAQQRVAYITYARSILINKRRAKVCFCVRVDCVHICTTRMADCSTWYIRLMILLLFSDASIRVLVCTVQYAVDGLLLLHTHCAYATHNVTSYVAHLYW